MLNNITSFFIALILASSLQGYASFEIESKFPTDRPLGTPTPVEAQAKADAAKKAADEAEADVEKLKDYNSYKALKNAQDKAARLKEEYRKAQELADSLSQTPKGK